MSTFDGHVKEFPDIRIDRFRHEPGSRPALAYFLSHVHTDHLVGLDANRGIFVYCSSATREILLKLEKYPHRMNFARGILESRRRTFKDLDKLLRPIPLETPTEIQLGYNRAIRVTLFDANHCTGSVMFLIEGDGNAILYTGDVRSELWWVNTLVRNPILLPYVASIDQPPLKRLDNIYLDTTFANKSDPYQDFPPKASGIMELLRKVSKYPRDTLFYFDAWTFGYEEVWQSLSAYLGSKIHVDSYRHRVYQSLLKGEEALSSDATKLNGARIGNDERKGGCLTTQQSRLHSCEKGTGCEIWSKQFVRLSPIISRHNGVDMAELGAGGGHGDLKKQHELDLSDPMACSRLMQLCYFELKEQVQLRDGVFEILQSAMENPSRTIALDLADLDAGAQKSHGDNKLDELPLVQAVHALAKRVARVKQTASTTRPPSAGAVDSGLPKQITFPYSRHSSYTELCMLIEAFKPKDIMPCTANEQDWTADRSMGHLFGHIYQEPILFTHDQAMFARHANDESEDAGEDESPETQYERQTQTPERETQLQVDFSSPPSAINRRRPSQDSPDDERRGNSPKRQRTSREGSYHPPPTINHYSPAAKPTRNVTNDHYSPPKRPARSAKIDNCSPQRRRTDRDGQLRSVTLQPQTPSAHIHTSRLAQVPTDNRPPSAPPTTRPPAETLQRMPVEDQSLTGKSWSQPSVVEDGPSSRSRQINRWQKRIAQSQHQSEAPWADPNAPSQQRPSPSYGRLSPPASVRETTERRPKTRPEWVDEEPSRRRQSVDYGRLSPPPASTPTDSEPEENDEMDEGELRLALQWEAHDAAMGIGQDWSVMSLVSVQNHQTKEEEL